MTREKSPQNPTESAPQGSHIAHTTQKTRTSVVEILLRHIENGAIPVAVGVGAIVGGICTSHGPTKVIYFTLGSALFILGLLTNLALERGPKDTGKG